ncbi:hypothetical protein EYR41_000666 [Orbilia oligospora]|uniref:Uncharacterized protein n=1 Tax=Orbilia oligospora TaxID=2813651 RepID=A0A8H2HYT5_ORBOL|nr:hypothetical protein EYR41_000666 [Orbilia oligospora]
MAPLRRYIKLTPQTTLQAQIFLEDPSLLHTWLIHPTNPALPRIIDSLKDLILPKLREERERERTGAVTKKQQAVKDVVSGSDFEVSVFFKDGTNRHALVMPRREFLAPKPEGGLKSNSSKMVLGNEVLDVGESENGGEQDTGQIANLRIENEEEEVDLYALPLALPTEASDADVHQADVNSVPARRSRRKTRTRGNSSDKEDNAASQRSEDGDRAEYQATTPTRRGSRTRNDATRRNTGKQNQREPITIDSGSDSEAEIVGGVGKDPVEETKKPLFRTSYEAYKIYGKILYLIVKKLDIPQATGQSEQISETVVTRDIPIAPGIEDSGTTEDVMEGWMYMSQVIREDNDL